MLFFLKNSSLVPKELKLRLRKKEIQRKYGENTVVKQSFVLYLN